MELSRICVDGISESSNSCRNHPPPVSEFLLGGIDNSPSKNFKEIEIPPSKDNPSKKPEQIEISPSKDSPSKKRRNWGEGNGTIHWRTITRGGKDYPQAYYHWQEKGSKKTKYIPKQILGDIQEAEFKKRPIREILTLLGVVPSPIKNTLLGDMENSPSKDVEQPEIPPSKNNPSNNSEQSEIPPSKDSPSNNVEQSKISSSKDSPSKTRRHKGLGSGSIQWKTITLHGKDYPQAWYHYEFWKDGDRLVKKCKYIPKRLLGRIEKLEADKAPVRDILSILRVKL
ncbi:hypothetical protein CDG77_19415 [Nostoc sp. 'Peltigera membranacea cyanobiont' 213]|uniref:hypothetical protein n=1 Tax=Nostoc sp. 'Peltigera membranacea cyanobiont' 213 TaxID=2014530 RepID=UPI000B95A24D|nr:hypothetical protein [Nostoc sp. 'Peltigera membranacea cyanobiont' 213]OYD89266.1 hypothetical protein CDG77_19415 [Nostoc sp. 'Peltigera membranacea cyanobiont' 213]